jgi:hypothetical protein
VKRKVVSDTVYLRGVRSGLERTLKDLEVLNVGIFRVDIELDSLEREVHCCGVRSAMICVKVPVEDVQKMLSNTWHKAALQMPC